MAYTDRLQKLTPRMVTNPVTNNHFARLEHLNKVIDAVNELHEGNIIRRYSTETGITAFATGGQASATLLTKEWNDVVTVATANDSVKLPALGTSGDEIGYCIVIKNSSANNLAIFPNTSDIVNGLSANASLIVAPGSVTEFRSISTSTWETPEAINIAALEELIATNGIQIIGDTKLEWRDDDLYIGSSVDGQLDVVADTTLNLMSPDIRFAYDAGAYMNVAVTDTSGATKITFVGNSDSFEIETSDGSITLDAKTDIYLDPEGNDIWLGDGTTNAGKITVAGTSTTIYGGDTTADDLVLQANSTDAYPVVTLNGLGIVDINTTVNITPTTDVTALVITGTNIVGNYVFDLIGLGLTTGSIMRYNNMAAKTSGYLFEGSMTDASTLDGTFIADEFDCDAPHDGLATDTLRLMRKTWSGDLPDNIDLAIYEGVLSSIVVGGGGAESGTISVYKADITAVLDGSAIIAAGFYADITGVTNTSSSELYGMYSVVNSSADAALRLQCIDAGALGAIASLYQNSSSPAVNDVLGRVDFRGEGDGVDTNVQYSYIDGIITDPTNGAEFGGVEVYAENGTGTPARVLKLEHDGGHAITTFGTTANGGLLLDAVTIGDGLSSSYFNIKTIKYSIADPTNSGGDYQASSAANKTEQNFQLGAGDIIPGLCRIIDITVVCSEKWVGSVGDEVMNTDLGTASSGQEYIAAGNIDDVTDINSFAVDSGLHIKTIVAASSVYVGLTPATNDWDEMTDGVTEIYITYIDNTAVV